MTKHLIMLAALALALPALTVAKTRTFVCEYILLASPDGVETVDNGKFILTFIVDSETEKAYMLGNLVTEDVTLILNEDGLNFVEVTDTGNVMLTTIIRGGYSIHSRHSIISEEAVPSQYYGSCITK